MACGRKPCTACLLLIYGIPASGKTLLARSIVKDIKQEKQYSEWNWLVVHFDDFYPPDTRSKMQEAPLESFDLKESRRTVRCCLEMLLTFNFSDSLAGISTFNSANQAAFAKFLDYLNFQQPIFDGNGRLKNEYKCPTVFILDDNMPLRSIRYEFYQVARNYEIGFAELCISSPLPIVLERNSLRTIPIPNSTISTMEWSLELPDPIKYQWEGKNAVIINDKDKNKFLIKGCESILHLVRDAIENPTLSITKVDTNLQEICRAANKKSYVHQADNILRKCVSGSLKDTFSGCEKGKIAQKANCIRMKLLEDVRTGTVTTPGNRMWEINTLDHQQLKEVLTEAFHNSLHSNTEESGEMKESA